MTKKKDDVMVVSIGVGAVPKSKLKNMKKAEMRMGGMANGKKHMYLSEGGVVDNAGLRALKASGPGGRKAYKQITGRAA